MTLRVVEWSTGTVGRHAIAGIDAHPDLELVGVWVSNPDKAGKDAGELAGLGRELGVTATQDTQALLALAPDCIVHTAMTDDRLFEAIEDLISFLRRGGERGVVGPRGAAVPDRRAAGGPRRPGRQGGSAGRGRRCT
jgi:2,4-diaminopentanoate dehydrogenase